MKKKKIIAFLVFYVVVIAGILVMYFFIQDRDKENFGKNGCNYISSVNFMVFNPISLYFDD